MSIWARECSPLCYTPANCGGGFGRRFCGPLTRRCTPRSPGTVRFGEGSPPVNTLAPAPSCPPCVPLDFSTLAPATTRVGHGAVAPNVPEVSDLVPTPFYTLWVLQPGPGN